MNIRLLHCTIGAVALAAFTVSTPAVAQPYNMTIAGASPGGLWTLIGTGVDSSVKAGYPGSTITYQTSGGGIANVGLLDQNRVQLGIVHDVELKDAQDGKPPFKAPIKSMRVLAYMYDWSPQQLVMTKDFADKYGIKTFDDLITKKPPVRMVLNRQGNIAAAVGAELFEAAGVTMKDIESWGGRVIYAASAEQADLMKDRRVDLINNSLFVRHASLLELGQTVPVVMLPISKSIIDKVAERMGTIPYVIKGGSYPYQPQDVTTVSFGAAIVANASMSDKDAYNLTKAMVENIDKVRGVHSSMKEATPELMASLKVAPYHPGAVKYYQEKGLMK